MWIRVGLGVSFLYVLMRQQVFPNRGLKVFETQTFCFLLDFINFFQDEREESKRGEGKKKKTGGPQEIYKDIKNLNATPLVSIKEPVDEETRYAANSSENTLDKAAIHAKSVPQSNQINRTTCHNH